MRWSFVALWLCCAGCSRDGTRAETNPAPTASATASPTADPSSAAQAPPSALTGAESAITCVGPSDAEQFIVYLHGMDTQAPGDQEAQNRAVLKRLADKAAPERLRFALPRASMACPSQPRSLCWGWSFDDAELQSAAASISAAQAKCFPQREFGLVGFSNGGYLLNKLLRRCLLKSLLPKARWMVSVGSARFEGELETKPESLRGCGSLILLSGSRDTHNSDPKHHLFTLLQTKGADVAHLEFDGGHSLEETSLARALERSSAPHPRTR